MNYLKIIFFLSAFLFIPLTANDCEENPLTLDKSTIEIFDKFFTKCSNDEVRIKAVNNSFDDYLLIIDKLDTACLEEKIVS